MTATTTPADAELWLESAGFYAGHPLSEVAETLRTAPEACRVSVTFRWITSRTPGSAEAFPSFAYQFRDGSMVWLRRPSWSLVHPDGTDRSGTLHVERRGDHPLHVRLAAGRLLDGIVCDAAGIEPELHWYASANGGASEWLSYTEGGRDQACWSVSELREEIARAAARSPDHPVYGSSDLCWTLRYPPVSRDMGACWRVVEALRKEPHGPLWTEVVQAIRRRAGPTPEEVLAWMEPESLAVLIGDAVLKPRRGARVSRPLTRG